MRSELLTLFKPAVRWALAQNSSGTHQGVLEGTQTVLTQLKEQKKEATLVKALMLLTRNTGKGKGKTGSMGASWGVQGQG